MKDELEQIFDNIAAAVVPEPQDYTDSETGLLFCGKCHTHKQCRVTLFGKEKLMPLYLPLPPRAVSRRGTGTERTATP